MCISHPRKNAPRYGKTAELSITSSLRKTPSKTAKRDGLPPTDSYLKEEPAGPDEAVYGTEARGNDER